MPKISRMRFRLLVTLPIVLGGRKLSPGDILDLDTADQSVVVATTLPWDHGAVLGHLADGALDPIAMTPSAVVLSLTPAAEPPPPRGVLAFRAPRRKPA